MSFKLTHSTLRRRVAMLFGTAAIATMGLAASMAGTASAEVPPYAYETHPYELCRFAAPSYDTHVDEMTQEEAELAVYCLVNQERAARSLPELKENTALTNGSRTLGNAAVEIKWWDNNQPHKNPRTQANLNEDEAIVTRIGETSYCGGRQAGYENAWSGYSYGAGAHAPTPREAVTWWMGSQHHRENILRSNVTEAGVGETGVGVVLGVPYKAAPANAVGAAFVQEFGTC